jgi:hypothetical protein
MVKARVVEPLDPDAPTATPERAAAVIGLSAG